MGASVQSGRMTAAIQLYQDRLTLPAVWTIEIVHGEMAASIVATACHAAFQQGAQCDCQTMTAFG